MYGEFPDRSNDPITGNSIAVAHQLHNDNSVITISVQYFLITASSDFGHDPLESNLHQLVMVAVHGLLGYVAM